MGLKSRSLLSVLALLISAGMALLPARAEVPAATEYQVKAAFIYNFAKFVEWPEEALANRPFVIGIVGQDPFGSLIDNAVAGKTVRNSKIVIRRFPRVEDAADSHILFVSGSEGNNVDRVLKQLGRAPILTVSDTERFAEQGGMVQLIMDQNRVRFAINVAAVERAGLKPSSQLLKLAKIVPGGGASRGLPPDESFADLSNHFPMEALNRTPVERMIPSLALLRQSDRFEHLR